MELHLYTSDLKPQFRGLQARDVRYEQFNEQAKLAILMAERATYHWRDLYEKVNLPPRKINPMTALFLDTVSTFFFLLMIFVAVVEALQMFLHSTPFDLGNPMFWVFSGLVAAVSSVTVKVIQGLR